MNENEEEKISGEVALISMEVMDQAEELRRQMMLYEAAVETMTTKLHILIREFRLGEDRSPIDNIQSRVKTPQSIADKMQRKGLPMTVRSMRENVFDIAGLRIVCPFLSDVYQVAQMLLRQEDVRLVKIKDYIAQPKPSGYRSLHLIVEVDVNLSDRRVPVPVELQLRTIAMNCWASVEHQLRYKKDELSEEMSEELRTCALLMSSMDDRVQALADSLRTYQPSE